MLHVVHVTRPQMRLAFGTIQFVRTPDRVRAHAWVIRVARWWLVIRWLDACRGVFHAEPAFQMCTHASRRIAHGSCKIRNEFININEKKH